MKYGQKPRDDSHKNRVARNSERPPKEDVIRAFGPMHTTLMLRHVELWYTVSETQGIIAFCAPDGEDMSGEVLRMDAMYSSACVPNGTFIDTELVAQLPPAEAAAMKVASRKAKAVLAARMEGRTSMLREVTAHVRRGGRA